VSSGGASAHGAFVELGLRDSDTTLAAWPHAFALRLRVSLSDAGTLRQDVTVRNTGLEALSFTFALHTYFRVADVAKATVRGLAGTPYLDSLQARARFTEEPEAIVFDKEVDRIYVGVPSTLTLADEGACRSFALATRGLPDAIVWNPWVAKAAAMADFGALCVIAGLPLCALTSSPARNAGDEEYKEMVCIEAAAVERAVVVAPGEQWEGGQTLSVDTLPSRR
jgi:glucose-6-phosphate 1-epimerase